MPLNVFTSNRLEILADELAHILKEPLSDPLAKEIIVVQSKGMERWLSLQLATRHGICANTWFPFPNAFVQFIVEKIFTAEEKQLSLNASTLFEPDILTWRIMKHLPELLDHQEFHELKRYLSDSSRDLKLLQLSLRIADLYDQYMLYRPEMIFKWESGQDAQWQAQLWRKLVQGYHKYHRAALGKLLIETLMKNPPEQHLPERVAVFGISTLPEFHMQVFNALAQHRDVNLFLMNPCQEYWGTLASEWELRRFNQKKKSDHNLELFYFDRGNKLLSSFGELGRDFFEIVESFNYVPYERFKSPGQTTLLTSVQSDILDLRDHGLSGEPPRIISAGDRSIQIHSCHSPRREVEVLQDFLLDLFEQHPDLKPADILVMTPEIEPYAPYIEAVFDLPSDDPKRIPFSIADRTYGHENEIFETFLAILNLYRSRFTASEILNILESSAVMKKFDISEENLSLIRYWIQKTRIRWGRDAKDRQQLNIPPNNQNTWQAGLDRLLLGYALPIEEELFQGEIAPYIHIEGEQAYVLGQFMEFLSNLFKKVDQFAKARSLQEWAQLFNEILETFFYSNDETMPQIQVLRETFVKMENCQQLARFDEPVELPVIKYYLQMELQRESHTHGFLTGGVTFCAMLPMRSIPAKVICLLGMNHDTYPREHKPLSFDLIAKHPKRGDRSRRKDDRYLFLEALLSAREILYISYVGQSIKDNSVIPPSVVVSELQDYLQANFKLSDDKDLLEHLITRHRLQAFSPKYFQGDSRLFSYSSENLEAARTLIQPLTEPGPFFNQKLPEPEEEFKNISLDDLYRFFINPVKFLLKRRLGIYLKQTSTLVEDRELFALKGLEEYKVAEFLMKKFMQDREPAKFKSLMHALGELPYGAIGDCFYEHLSQEVVEFVKKVKKNAGAFQTINQEIDVRLDDFSLTGKIEQIGERHLPFFRYTIIKAKDYLRAWIYHLVFNLPEMEQLPDQTLLCGLKKKKNDGKREWIGIIFKPVPDSKDQLRALLEIYWQGLCEPIRFFPDSAKDYVEKLIANKKKKDVRAAYKVALRTWQGSHFNGGQPGEGEDPYLRLVFGKEENPLNEEFRGLAKKIFIPIFEYSEEIGT